MLIRKTQFNIMLFKTTLNNFLCNFHSIFAVKKSTSQQPVSVLIKLYSMLNVNGRQQTNRWGKQHGINKSLF